MEPRKTYLDVPIKDKTYRLNKLDARSTCWLFAFLAEKSQDNAILSSLGRCTKLEFEEIQGMCLRNTFFIDYKEGNSFPTSVIDLKGSLIDSTLKEEPDALFNITAEFIMFNLKPFLVDRESNSQSPKE